MSEPAFSVRILTYNQASLLREAMESVLSQEFENFELLVVDDSSPGNTRKMVQSLDDSRVRYVRNEMNLGLGRARNAARISHR